MRSHLRMGELGFSDWLLSPESWVLSPHRPIWSSLSSPFWDNSGILANSSWGPMSRINQFLELVSNDQMIMNWNTAKVWQAKLIMGWKWSVVSSRHHAWCLAFACVWWIQTDFLAHYNYKPFYLLEKACVISKMDWIGVSSARGSSRYWWHLTAWNKAVIPVLVTDHFPTVICGFSSQEFLLSALNSWFTFLYAFDTFKLRPTCQLDNAFHAKV